MKLMRSVFVLMLVLLATASQACEIRITEKDKESTAYAVGDEVILIVSVLLPHRNCHVGIEETKFQSEGLKILGATPWKEIKFNTFERMLKVQITEDAEKEAILHARRTCNKEGGYGIIKLAIE
ncbi:hypothetical protein JW992_04310 [candidate division KSB1 bacterium]|nr:hypothetical protein [candidate division KSB1 bacterium]